MRKRGVGRSVNMMNDVKIGEDGKLYMLDGGPNFGSWKPLKLIQLGGTFEQPISYRFEPETTEPPQDTGKAQPPHAPSEEKGDE